MHNKLSHQNVAVEEAEHRLARAHEELRDRGAHCDEEELAKLHGEIEAANAARRSAHAMESTFTCRVCKELKPVGAHVAIVFDHVVRRDPDTGEYRNYFENNQRRKFYLQICESCDDKLGLIDYSKG